jgi:hypothetical protein
MSPSKSKCWYSNNCLHFFKAHCSIYNETLVSLNKKCIFEHYREFQARKTLLIDIIFAIKKFFDLFRAASYMLILVLHQDALFHCKFTAKLVKPFIIDCHKMYGIVHFLQHKICKFSKKSPKICKFSENRLTISRKGWFRSLIVL